MSKQVRPGKAGKEKAPSIFAPIAIVRIRQVYEEKKTAHERCAHTKYTHEDLAKPAHLERSAVTHILNEDRKRTEFDTLVQIAIAHDLSLDWLISGDGERQKVWDGEVRRALDDLGKAKKQTSSRNRAPVIAAALSDHEARNPPVPQLPAATDTANPKDGLRAAANRGRATAGLLSKQKKQRKPTTADARSASSKDPDRRRK